MPLVGTKHDSSTHVAQTHTCISNTTPRARRDAAVKVTKQHSPDLVGVALINQHAAVRTVVRKGYTLDNLAQAETRCREDT